MDEESSVGRESFTWVSRLPQSVDVALRKRSVDPEKPMVTSGVRLGTPAATSRVFGVAEFKKVGELIVETLDGLAKNGDEANASVEESVKQRVHELIRRFPIYG